MSKRLKYSNNKSNKRGNNQSNASFIAIIRAEYVIIRAI